MRKMIGKVVSALLCAITVASVFGPAFGNVNAEQEDSWKKNAGNTRLGCADIADPAYPPDNDYPWMGSYVYFGSNGQSALRFRVLDHHELETGRGLFLDCDRILFDQRYDYDDNNWENCELRSRLNDGFLNNYFSPAEQEAILPTVERGASDSATGNSRGGIYGKTPLYGDKIFILDANDITNTDYGYTNLTGWETSSVLGNGNRVKFGSDGSDYWLRGASDYYQYNIITRVDDSGVIDEQFVNKANVGVSPALNVDLDSVLFSSIVSSGRFGKMGSEYKLTLIDNDLRIDTDSIKALTASGRTVTVPYKITGSSAPDAEQISILIINKKYTSSNSNNAEIIYYGKLNGAFARQSSGSFTLPSGLDMSGWGKDYHVYILAETLNGQFESDYSSSPLELNKPQATPRPAGTNPTSAPARPTASGSTSSSSGSQISIPSASPASASSVPTVNVSSSVGIADFVERLYTVALNRPSDPYGKADWINRVYTQGYSGADVARGFLFSDEFLSKNMSNSEFLGVLYKTFFDREPDAELANWLRLMDQGWSKTDVIDGFINSTEWANLCLTYRVVSGSTFKPNIRIAPTNEVIDFASRLYTTCLGREPEQEGLINWAGAIANMEISGSDAAYGFFFSAEFIDGGYSDSEYVKRLYRTFMGREYDQGGFDYWIGRISDGASREEVFRGFADSAEWTQICAGYGILK